MKYILSLIPYVDVFKSGILNELISYAVRAGRLQLFYYLLALTPTKQIGHPYGLILQSIYSGNQELFNFLRSRIIPAKYTWNEWIEIALDNEFQQLANYIRTKVPTV